MALKWLQKSPWSAKSSNVQHRAGAMDDNTRTIEADLEDFIATKIHDFLGLFLNEQSHEPVKHHVLGIAKFGMYIDDNGRKEEEESVNACSST